MSLLVQFLAAYGICFALMNDKIAFLSKALRALPILRNQDGLTFFTRMLRCPYCTGFHAGWITWVVTHIAQKELGLALLPDAILFAFASSAFCYVVDIAAQKLEG